MSNQATTSEVEGSSPSDWLAPGDPINSEVTFAAPLRWRVLARCQAGLFALPIVLGIARCLLYGYWSELLMGSLISAFLFWLLFVIAGRIALRLTLTRDRLEATTYTGGRWSLPWADIKLEGATPVRAGDSHEPELVALSLEGTNGLRVTGLLPHPSRIAQELRTRVSRAQSEREMGGIHG